MPAAKVKAKVLKKPVLKKPVMPVAKKHYVAPPIDEHPYLAVSLDQSLDRWGFPYPWTNFHVDWVDTESVPFQQYVFKYVGPATLRCMSIVDDLVTNYKYKHPTQTPMLEICSMTFAVKC